MFEAPKGRMYMAVTADEYELPIFWTENSHEMMEWCGYRDMKAFWNRVAFFKNGRLSGKIKGWKVVTVDI